MQKSNWRPASKEVEQEIQRVRHRRKYRMTLSSTVYYMLLAAFNLWDDQRASRQSEAAAVAIQQARKENEEAERSLLPQTEEHQLPFYEEFPDVEMPVITSEGIDYIGTLEITPQALTLPVIDKWSDSNLKKAPCRYSGSIYTKDAIICAHNYTTHFGCLASLEPGTPLQFTDCDGNVFFYEVSAMEILKPEDTEAIQEGDWDLTLFTCTLGGGSRVTLRCNMTDAVPME